MHEHTHTHRQDMLKTSPSLWLWEHTSVGVESPTLRKDASVWSVDSGSLSSLAVGFWTGSVDCSLVLERLPPLPPFCKSVDMKSNAVTSHTSNLPDHISLGSEDSAISLPFDPITSSDPSSSTPGPSTWCHVLLETLLTSQIEQEPRLLHPVGACHVTSGPTRTWTQLSIKVFQQLNWREKTIWTKKT